jgi:hypothetical protein
VTEVFADEEPPRETPPPRRGQPVPLISDAQQISPSGDVMEQTPRVEQPPSSLSESVSPSGDVTPQSLLSSESVQQAQSVTPSQESPVEYRQRTPQEIAELKEKQKAIINEWYKDGAREMKALNEVALQSIPRSEVASKFISGLVSNQDWIRMRGVDVHDLLYNKMPPPFVPGQSNPYWPLRNAVTTLSKEFNIKPMPRETLDSFFGRALNQDGVTAGRLAELLKKAR